MKYLIYWDFLSFISFSILDSNIKPNSFDHSSGSY
jgi:hypothetical protein